MKIHRFLGDFDFSAKVIKTSDREQINQFKNVLRLSVGDTVALLDGNGHEARATVKELHKDLAEFAIEEVIILDNEPVREVTLYCAILKRENFELVAQKATEIGVKEIVPIITKRTIKTGLNQERLKKIIREAVEQSGRGIIPEIHEALDLEEAIKHASADNKNNFLFDISGEAWSNQIVGSSGEKIGIFIGPEGGWEAGEIEMAKNNGFHIAKLGGLTLRGETAAIVASYLACQN
ncbi:MAG: RsmE family RNA methyltransferase [bacterium]